MTFGEIVAVFSTNSDCVTVRTGVVPVWTVPVIAVARSYSALIDPKMLVIVAMKRIGRAALVQPPPRTRNVSVASLANDCRHQ
jgi:hypothetical protein